MTDEFEPERLADALRPRLYRLSQALRRESASSPLTTAQTSVLSLLMLGKPLRISDLARAEAVRLPTMTQVVKRMVEAGWVFRTGSSRSSSLVDITDAGRAMAREVARARNEALTRRIARVSAADRRKLAAVVPILDIMFEREPWRTQ